MEAVVDEKDNKPKRSCMLVFIPLIVCLFFAVVLVPLGVMFLRPLLNGHTKAHVDPHMVAALAAAASASAASASVSAARALATQNGLVPPPPNYRNTIFDTSTWLDRGFNTTFTTETQYGLPIMGLWSDWSDTARPNPWVSPLIRSLNAPVRSVSLDGWLTRHDNTTMYSLKDKLERHYSALKLADFEAMAEAGLNCVRIPLPHWMVTPIVGEPYLPMVGWRYFLRALEWARQTGLRVEVQLLPGRAGERAVEAATRYLSQQRYSNLVTFMSVVGAGAGALRDYGFEGTVVGVDLALEKMQFGSLEQVCGEWPAQIQPTSLCEWTMGAGTTRLERAVLKDVARGQVSVFEQGAGWVFRGWSAYQRALDAGVLLNFNASHIDLWCDARMDYGTVGYAVGALGGLGANLGADLGV